MYNETLGRMWNGGEKKWILTRELGIYRKSWDEKKKWIEISGCGHLVICPPSIK